VRTIDGIEPRDIDSVADICRTSVRSATLPIRGIVHLWSLDAAASAALDADALASAEADHCASALAVIKAASSLTSSAPPCWFVTSHAQSIENTPAIEQAAVWGLARTLAIEHPSIPCICIDVPADTESAIAALLREIGAPKEALEPELAVRGGARFVHRLARVQGSHAPLPVRDDATYLVTGGLGALGLGTAEWLVARGARHLVLTGRSAPSARAAEQLDRLRASGAAVETVRADVSKKADVDRLFAAIAASGFPLKGIVHSAGVLDDGIALQQTWDRLRNVFASKVAGSWNLHLASAALPLDFFVLYSSLAALLGSAGQANYAAGNAFVDALARLRKSEGLPSLSVGWGRWGGSGMAASLNDADRRRLTDAGFIEMNRDAAFAALESAIASGRAYTAILAVDWNRYAAYRGAPLPFLAALDRAVAHDASAPKSPALLVARQEAPAERRKAIVLQHVRRDVLAVLGLAGTQRLDDEQGLRDAGLDSLMALELKNRLQASTGQALPSTVAFDYPTTAALAAFVAEALGDTIAAVTPAAAAAAASPDLDAMSDEEAEALLAEELAELNRARGGAPSTSRSEYSRG
jgi:acyl carrier protein